MLWAHFCRETSGPASTQDTFRGLTEFMPQQIRAALAAKGGQVVMICLIGGYYSAMHSQINLTDCKFFRSHH